MATFRLAFIAPLVIVFALLAAACGSTSSTDTASAELANSNAAGVELGELDTTNGEPFMFSSVVNEPTVVWFWGPG